MHTYPHMYMDVTTSYLLHPMHNICGNVPKGLWIYTQKFLLLLYNIYNTYSEDDKRISAILVPFTGTYSQPASNIPKRESPQPK